MAAIYQRARPLHWDEVVGQEHVKDVLRPAVERGRIGHAYLFSGPRGVGKTTSARLIAMAVNCERRDLVRPCGQCSSCQMTIAGRHPDVVEIDAASNNSVDDVRDLREKVALQPMQSSHKVYILDEAHMMTKNAFNALLKTLEEPPGHVVFILATTEPERLPPTILSRCQHYRFRRLSEPEIAGKLRMLAGRENVEAEAGALELVARAADGAMRDGESMLERLLAAGNPFITVAEVEAALGLPPQDAMQALALALAKAETGPVLTMLHDLYAAGFAPRTLTERTKIALRDLLRGQIEDKNSAIFPDMLLLKLIRALDEEDARFARASDLISLEMAFARALLIPVTGATIGTTTTGTTANSDPSLLARVAALERALREQPTAAGPASRPSLPDFDPNSRSPRRSEAQTPPIQSPSQPPSQPVAPSQPPSQPQGSWTDVQKRAPVTLRAFLKEAKTSFVGDTFVIAFDARYKFHAENTEKRLEEVAKAVWEVFGPVAVELQMPDGAKKNARPDGSTSGVAVKLGATAPVPVPTAPAPALTAPVPAPTPPPIAEMIAPALQRIAQTMPVVAEVMPITDQTPVSMEQLDATLDEDPFFASLVSPPGAKTPAPAAKPVAPLALVAAVPEQYASNSLEEFVIPAFDDDPELRAFDLFDVDTVVGSGAEALAEAAAPTRSKLRDHPNYQYLAKRQKFKVREAGDLVVPVAKAEVIEIEP
jgi:DNA polymerase III subunit gamma/tau